MAHPKRQHSKQRSRKRRTHDNLDTPQLGQCSHCSKPILPHRVCPFCGYYKGQPVMEAETQEEKKK
ncbi:MAG: 50S ribosomal protein L32 [Candidatus Omnitrophica bacterium]|nr:50S ribosomal protein L32 [Candidatus Omnitrophota bacterium]